MSSSPNLLHKAASALKVQLSRQAGRLVGTERELTLSFEKDDWGGWPTSSPWGRPRAALAMVDGADTFLICSAAAPTTSRLTSASTPKMLGGIELPPTPRLRRRSPLHVRRRRALPQNVVCGVTEFVFGEMPERIWFKVS